MIAIWSTLIGPQLCRVGLLNGSCAEVPHRHTITGDHHDCEQLADFADPDEPAYPHQESSPYGSCKTCVYNCGLILKPADADEHSHVLQLDMMPHPATLIEYLQPDSSEASRYTSPLHEDRPVLPQPASDFPLLI